VAVCGIQTQFCVLATVFDALCHDFRTILLEDLSSSHKREVHRAFMNAYRKSLLLPILRVMTSHAFLDELDKKE
jgi:nicotinamidase-related amidase